MAEALTPQQAQQLLSTMPVGTHIQNIYNANTGKLETVITPPKASTSTPASSPTATTQKTVNGLNQTNQIAPQQNKPVVDNSSQIAQMFEQQRQQAIAQLKQAIQTSKSKFEQTIANAPNQYQSLRDKINANYNSGIQGYQTAIEQAPQTFQPLKNQSEVDRMRSLETLREAITNAGDRGGIGRQQMLSVDNAAANRLNDLNIQQQNTVSAAQKGMNQASLEKANALADIDRQQQQVISDAQRAIADLEASGNFQEAQVVAQNASDKIRALIEEGNRVEQTSYSRLQDAIQNNQWQQQFNQQKAVDTANLTGIYAPSPQSNYSIPANDPLRQYSNDYQAEINRRMAINPNDPAIPILQQLRQEKIASNPAQYGTPTLAKQQLDAALKAGNIDMAIKQLQLDAMPEQLRLDIEGTRAGVAGKILDNQLKQIQIDTLPEIQKLEVQKLQKNLQSMDIENAINQINLDYLPEKLKLDIESTRQGIDLRNKQFEESVRINNFQIEQWQKEMSFKEMQASIQNALESQRISQAQAANALSWAKFNADQDPNSVDNRLKAAQLDQYNKTKNTAQFYDYMDNAFVSKDSTTGAARVDYDGIKNYLGSLKENGVDEKTLKDISSRYGIVAR